MLISQQSKNLRAYRLNLKYPDSNQYPDLGAVSKNNQVNSKEELNPIYHPECLEELLFCILRTDVKIRQVIPNDGTRIAEEQSLVIMDIVVELMDGSLANVEIQRSGYLFP